MKGRVPFVASLMLAGADTACTPAAPVPSASGHPATRTVDVVGAYHGTEVPDPYRWLESLDSPEVRAWAAAQTSHALAHLRATDAGSRLLARMDALQEFFSEPPGAPPGEPLEPAPPLVAPESLAPDEELAGVWGSLDGQHAAYVVATPGSEALEGRIRRIADGVDLAERLAGLDEHPLVWSRDGGGFFYGRILLSEPAGEPEPNERAVYYHRLGTSQATDVALLRTGAPPTLVYVDFELSADGRFLVATEGTGPTVEGLGHLNSRLQVFDLGDPARPTIGGAPYTLSASRDAAYRVVATRGDSLYLLTDRGAPTRRLVVLAAEAPDVEQWRDVVPAGPDVIDHVQEIGDHFVVRYVRDVQHGVRVYERDGRLVRELPIRPMTTILDLRADGAGGLVVDAIEGFASTRRRYDPGTARDSTELEVKAPSPADPYELRQVWYTSKDGTRVPMFLAHRRGLPLDGSHPTLLSGYGASGSIEMPYFGPRAVALLELGFVLAAPSLRGGGEFGRAWHEAATLGRKQTTFDDFIAAAEYLVQQRYTSSDRLAIVGASNGGLLVSSVLTQRPDLFRVAVAEVPPTDLLRFEPGVHRVQYGSSEDPAHVPFLLASSALHHVQPGTCYPSTLITTAFDDDVIPAWNAFKFAAALQAAQSCDRPVLLRADTVGGHGGIGPVGASDMFGFILTELGLGRME